MKAISITGLQVKEATCESMVCVCACVRASVFVCAFYMFIAYPMRNLNENLKKLLFSQTIITLIAG